MKLKDVFDQTEFVHTSRGVRAAIPDFFYYVDTMGSRLLGAASGLRLVKIQQPVGVGRSPQESFLNMTAKVLELCIINGNLIRFLPKPPQAPTAPLLSGQFYEIVRRDHPLHDHQSRDLLDFVYISPTPQGLRDCDFDSGHSHARRISRAECLNTALGLKK